MKKDRREFLKIAGISVGVSVLGGSLTYIHASGSSNQKKVTKHLPKIEKPLQQKDGAWL
jgi:hypothetical protein